ncbi:MAG: hypothetical protein K8J31_01295, partial [Anaerolineae bacterium]|nr:hypothetical protein [Anaerolineae bacterium]
MNTNYEMLVTQDEARSKKDERQRMTYYVEWLTSTERMWYMPDLDAYRDYLLEYRKLEPSSAIAHISTVKARYKNLLRDQPGLVTVLQQAAPSIEEQPTFVNEVLKTIEQATSPDAGKIEFERNVRVFHLTRKQIDTLLAQPNVSTNQGIRDVTAIGLMYCVGISETELCSLQVSDLDQEKDGIPAIHVPETAGGTERLAPLFDGLLFTQNWLQRYIRAMLEVSLVSDGLIF